MRTYLTLTSHHLQPKATVAAWAAWNSLLPQELDVLPGEGGRAALSTGSSYSGDSGMLGTAEVAARATWAAWPRLQVVVQSLYQTPHPLLCSPELDSAQFYSPDMDRLGSTPQFTDRENGVSALLILFAFSRVDPQRRRGLTPTMPACLLFLVCVM